MGILYKVIFLYLSKLPRRYLGAILCVSFAASFLLGYSAFSPHEFTVTPLNVSSGKAALVETPSGAVILIGSGTDAGILRELGRTLPFSRRSIDMVIAPDTSVAHIGGMQDVFARYAVSHTVRAPRVRDTKVAERFLEAILREPDNKEFIAKHGQRFAFGDGVYIEVLAPDTLTEMFAVKIADGTREFLFPPPMFEVHSK